MLVHAKTPHTDLRIEGKVSPKVLHILKLEFGKKLHVEEDFDDDKKLVNIEDTPWWKEMQAKDHPGKAMRVYRSNKGWTLDELGKKLGGFSRHYVLDMEAGRRGISKAIAKKLSVLFSRPVELFL